jgi:hypothetical protein
MIATQNTAIEVESNITGNKIAMGLHVDATAHLMGVLTNIYKDSILAAIREYSTNAADAHIAAGYDGPIEIELPNQLKPLLVIRDHGIGMSEQDIKDIYSQYGASTKRETDDQQGCLGLGCKSALAYAHQFTLQSVKDHKRTTVVISREADGGSMTVTSVIDTTEANGTEITIPCNPADAWKFQEKAAFLFSFWDEGTVLVDGEAPEQIKGLDVTEEIKLIPGAQDYIVMGGIPYPTTIRTHLNNRGIAVWVPMGSVSFVPSREHLEEEAANTKECIKAIEEVFAHYIPSTVQRAIDNCATKPEALQTMIDWDRLMPRSVQSVNYTYKGEQLPINLTSSQTMFTAEQHQGWGTKVGKHSKDRQIYAAQWASTLWVTNYDRESYTATTRKKIDKYLRDHLILAPKMFEYYTCVADKTLDIAGWVEPDRIVDWKLIEPIKLPRKGREVDPNRPACAYDMYVVRKGQSDYKMGVEDTDINTNLPVLHCDSNYSHGQLRVLTKFLKDFTLVELSPNRVNKFQRNFPMSKEASHEARKLKDQWLAKVRPMDRLAATIQAEGYQAVRSLNAFDHTKLEDPALRKAVRLVKRDVKKTVERAKELGVILNVKWENPFDNYPLYDVYCNNMDHLYIYLNAAYAADKEKK